MKRGRKNSEKNVAPEQVVPEEYVVEKVVGKKTLDDGSIMYLIKWEGYAENENTWEPKDNITSKALIAHYEKSLKSKEGSLAKSDEENVPKSKEKSPVKVENKTERKNKRKSIKTENAGTNVSEDNTYPKEENSSKKGLTAETAPSDQSMTSKGRQPPKKKRANEASTDEASSTISERGDDNEPSGFGRNLPPEEIVGATEINGNLTFLLKWKGSEEASLVPAHEANVKCPQLVIKFYEARLTWKTDED